MNKGIVAYKAEYDGKLVSVERTYATRVEHIETDNWDELVLFLTKDIGSAIHICWSLNAFTHCIFAILPKSNREELSQKNRIYYGDSKIFSVDRYLGLTYTKQLGTNNFYIKQENNFFGIHNWLPDSMKEPSTVKEVEQLGIEILENLNKMHIYPSTLTSPIGVYSQYINSHNFPTIYTFNDSWLDAMIYADKMARYEWNEVFSNEQGYWYDIISAYPYCISQLPNTNICKAVYSKKIEVCDWGVMKGRVRLSKDINPINEHSEYFSIEEIVWLEKHDAGSFEFEDGWFITFTGKTKPYQTIIDSLLDIRNSNSNNGLAYLTKRIAQGLSGKLDQYNKDDTLGDFYNPIYAAMVRSRCRLAVGDFIYDNKLQDSLIQVKVDGVKCKKFMQLPQANKPGHWRNS